MNIRSMMMAGFLAAPFISNGAHAATQPVCEASSDAKVRDQERAAHQRAIDQVRKLPEFVKWEQLVKQAGRQAAFIEQQDGRVKQGSNCVWIVTAYESVDTHLTRWKTFRLDLQGKPTAVMDTEGNFISLAQWRAKGAK